MIEPIERFSLPRLILEGLRAKGIESFTPPQAEAIKRGVLEGKNIVVVAPTASGKTLIGEIALVNAALRGLMGVYVTPLKALAHEKYLEFQFWEQYGFRVGISTGDYDEPGEELGKYDIVVATYERLDSILRHRPSWLSRVGVFVIDELHNIGDPERGPIVELIVTRALYLGKQVVGLSATVGNPEKLAKWLSAELVFSEWRPVKLVEGYFDRHRREIVFSDGRVEEVEGDVVTHSVLKAMEGDYQILIFKQARRAAENLAQRIASIVDRYLEPQEKKMLEELVQEYKSSAVSRIEFDNLSQLILRGVAYHHAGLSLAARRIVEKGFRSKLIKVVVATPTLAAGINLPARRVLIYTRRFENGVWKSISIAEYKQMAGRAGRPQYDPYGEAIIVDAPPKEAEHYIKGKPEDVRSYLWSKRALRIHILAAIASGYARRYNELIEFFSKSFGAQDYRIIFAQSYIVKTIRELESFNMIERSDGEFIATKLGEVVSKLYLDPLTAKIIIDTLKDRNRVQDLFYLHLIAMSPDFSRVRITRYSDLYEEAMTLASSDSIPSIPDGIEEISSDDWLRGYKIARILYEWINEVDEDSIIKNYGIGIGDLLNIVDTATWLIHAASKVCRAMGMDVHARTLEILSIRVENGVKEDAVELVQIKGIGRVRARTLLNAGIKTIEDLINTPRSRLISLHGFGEKIVNEILREAEKLLELKKRGQLVVP